MKAKVLNFKNSDENEFDFTRSDIIIVIDNPHKIIHNHENSKLVIGIITNAAKAP